MSVFSRISVLAIAAAALTVCADGGGENGAGTSGATAAASSVTPTGRVIDVQMVTDEKGNRFEPATIQAARGDVVRFTLKTGVHNVNFLPDSNAGTANLPKASEFLQLPGQTWDLTVALDAGSYYFQCDPHALLGMVGRLEVR